MNNSLFLKEATRIATRTMSSLNSDGEEIVFKSKTLVPFLRQDSKTIRDTCLQSMTAFSKIVMTECVVYPGCGIDIFRCLAMTNARRIIGIDIVDRSFYPGSRTATADTAATVELVSIFNQLSRDLQFTFVEIQKNRLELRFQWAGARRTVVIYIANANTFPEITEPCGVFLAGFRPSAAFFKRFKPVFVIAPRFEFSSPSYTVTKTAFVMHLISKDDGFEEILDVTNGAMLIVKAHALKQRIIDDVFELFVARTY